METPRNKKSPGTRKRHERGFAPAHANPFGGKAAERAGGPTASASPARPAPGATGEVLAPAGSFAALRAACAAGADAVYFGAGDFNARKNAENIAEDEIGQAVGYCHARGVRAYFTLNTVVFGREVKAALELAARVCAAGADGIILQDMGLAALLRRAAPGMPLHASTQMSVHSPEGVRELAELGFSRAVLARELSRAELARIAAGSPLELEVFVHGAHCMSVSGQCYMSAFFGGRSGNRGLCAQPCRLPFSAENGEGARRGEADYALSLRDLSLLDRLGELPVPAGRLSLKIEGRRKRPEYVAAVTSVCARAAHGGKIDESELAELAAVFSRSGFTRGYFDGARGREMFGRRTEEEIAASSGAMKKYRALCEGPEPARVPVDFAFFMEPGGVRLQVSDGDGNEAAAFGGPPEPAVCRELDENTAREKLAKTGGTPFLPARIACSLLPGATVPVSALNALRREALQKLLEKRAAPRPVPFAMPELSTASAPAAETAGALPPQLRLRLRTRGQIPDRFPAGVPVELVFLPLDELGDAPRLPDAREGAAPRLGVELPRVFYGDEEELLRRLEALREAGVRDALCGGLSSLRLARRAGLAPHGDFGLNVTNPYAAAAYAARGAASLLGSLEAPAAALREVAAASPVPCGMTVYGFLPLQLARVCPVRSFRGCPQGGACGQGGACALADGRGARFPVLCSEKRYAEVLNSRPLWLADAKAPAEKASPTFLQFYFSAEDAAAVRQVLEAWRDGAPCPGEFTRGLYAHGVK